MGSFDTLRKRATATTQKKDICVDDLRGNSFLLLLEDNVRLQDFGLEIRKTTKKRSTHTHKKSINHFLQHFITTGHSFLP